MRIVVSRQWKATPHHLHLATLMQKLFEDIQRRKATAPPPAAMPGLEREIAPAPASVPEAAAPNELLQQSRLPPMPPDLSAAPVSQLDTKAAADQHVSSDVPGAGAAIDGAPRQVLSRDQTPSTPPPQADAGSAHGWALPPPQQAVVTPGQASHVAGVEQGLEATEQVFKPRNSPISNADQSDP